MSTLGESVGTVTCWESARRCDPRHSSLDTSLEQKPGLTVLTDGGPA